MAKANLLVTHDPNHAGLAKEEVVAVLKQLKTEPVFLKSEIEGLFQITIKEPKETIKKLVKTCKKDPSVFRITFHWIPVDNWCKSTVEDMQKTIKGLVKDIKEKDKWKIDIAKRCYEKYNTTELIMKLTDVVDRPKVDLKNPDKIIRVDIIGNDAGISLLNKDEMLNIPALKK